MAISRDSFTASPTSGFGSGTSISWSHTVGSGATLIIINLIGLSGTTPTAITVGGVSIASNLVTSVSHTVGNGTQDFMYYMNNPSSGSQTISVTYSDSQGILAGYSTTYFGTDTTTAVIDSSNTAVVSSPSSANNLVQATTVVNANCWMVGIAVFSNGGTMSINNSGNLLHSTVNDPVSWDSNATVGTGSQSFTITSSAAADHWGGMVASIKPGGAVATVLPFKSLLGVGI